MRKKYLPAILLIQVMLAAGCNNCSVDFQSSKSKQARKQLMALYQANSMKNNVIVSQPVSQCVAEGASTAMSVVVNSTGSYHFRWMKDDAAVGTDSARLAIDSVNTSHAGNYHVIVTTPVGPVTSDTAVLSVIPAALSDRSYTLAVWLQEALDTVNGKTLAQNYRDLGINTYAGLWEWPREDWAWAGYSVQTARALKDAGIVAYAGNDAAAVQWLADHPEFHDTIIGYLLGDEPDMNRDSGIPEIAAANTPLAWSALGDSLLALDNTRPVYANFGKPFAKDAWYGNENGQTGSKEGDFTLYVGPCSVISSDFYGITDPWEPPSNHGIWTYGRSVRNTRMHSSYGGVARTVWGFVETSAPWTDASSDNWMYQRIPPSYIMPIVWNMVIGGAQGIVYFCHDFSPASLGKYAALLEPGMPEAMKAANESVLAFGAVIKAPTVSGTTVASGGPVEVISLTKQFAGSLYIFAMSDGNRDHRDSLAVDAGFTISGQTGVKSVALLNEPRTITMIDGRFTDHFEPYELHIYRISD